MSVGPYNANLSAKMLKKMGGEKNGVICLPRQFEDNASSYEKVGFEVFVYDEKKYINEDFEFFGFKPRNCGGVGRQGIAEAVDKYGDDFLCFQIDDDYKSFNLRREDPRKKIWEIHDFNDLCLMIYAFAFFYELTGIEVAAKVGNRRPGTVFVGKKIFNNFVMRKGRELNYFGFAALCSDDQRYNYLLNLTKCTPTLCTSGYEVVFPKAQGERGDGNAVLYNGDCSWKKSFSLKMMLPWCTSQYIKKEGKLVKFREHIETSKLYPPILLEQDGKIVEKVIFKSI